MYIVGPHGKLHAQQALVEVERMTGNEIPEELAPPSLRPVAWSGEHT